MRALLLAALCSCGIPEPLPPYVPSIPFHVTAEEGLEPVTARVVAEFVRQAPSLFTEDGTSLRVIVWPDMATWPSGLAIGVFDAYHMEIRLQPNTVGTDPHLDLVIAHELGHALGLAHSADLKNIMHETLSQDIALPVAVGQIVAEVR